MPMKRPSSVEAIVRAAAIPPKGDPVIAEMDEEARREREEYARRAVPPKPVRITLNLPPDLYRELVRFLDRKGDDQHPRVGVQPGLRAMIRAMLANSPEASAMMSSYLRYELSGRSEEA